MQCFRHFAKSIYLRQIPPPEQERTEAMQSMLKLELGKRGQPFPDTAAQWNFATLREKLLTLDPLKP